MTAILPPIAVLELTWRCNHACMFCSCPWFGGMLAPGPEMHVDEWKRLIDEYSAAGVRQFSFTGGEALMKDGCLELVDYASRRAAVNLLSNGRLVDETVIRFCAARDIRLSVSMPGLQTFAANTLSDTPVSHILAVFAKCRELGCKATCGVAVTQLNLPELYETLSAALVAGADSILLNRFLPGGRGLAHPELFLNAEDVRRSADIAEEVLSRARRYGHFGTELPACLLDASRYRYLNVTTGCSAATGFFCVGPGGMIRVCNHSPVEIARWDEWESLPANEEWMHYFRHDYLPAACAGCSRAAACMGGCREAARVLYGSPVSPDPLMAR